MAESNSVVERRKTAHLNEQFKKYVNEELCKALGVNLNQEDTWTIFKLCNKLPMRFLPTISEEDLDVRGERAISVPGIARFKFRNTVAQGGNKKTLADGTYPRYKVYPAPALEKEVEVIHGIADDTVVANIEKQNVSEVKHVERLQKNLQSVLGGTGEMVVGTTDSTPVTIETIIGNIIGDKLKDILGGAGVASLASVGATNKSHDVHDDDLNEELDNYDDIENDDEDDSDANSDDGVVAPVVEEKKETKKGGRKSSKKEEKKEVASVVEEKKEVASVVEEKKETTDGGAVVTTELGDDIFTFDIDDPIEVTTKKEVAPVVEETKETTEVTGGEHSVINVDNIDDFDFDFD